jgi:RNA polymerase sigma-70 factor (ECF subfamily)
MELSVPSYESEDYLVQQAVKGDRSAFSSLYYASLSRVYRHVYYRVSNQADAEDITQEAFTRAWKAMGKYRKTAAPFIAWVITIADHLIVDHYRTRQKITKINKEYANNPTSRLANPEEQAEANLNNALIKAAVLKLKGDKQRVILMRFIDGFSCEEIARTLKKTQNAVRVIQFRALADLKRLLESG